MLKNICVCLFLLLLSFSGIASNTKISSIGFNDLPEPISNNAIAHVKLDNQDFLLSFMGLAKNKSFKDVHDRAFLMDVSKNQWTQINSVPSSISPKGRLASVAIGIGSRAYIFGGYTVDAEHNEISSPDNFAFDLSSRTYQKIATMPVPVDDAVALSYQQRYIYIISGWHNDGNVNLVQVYDIKSDSWQQATPFPGAPVFGHAGAIVDKTMLICDGVKLTWEGESRRQFDAQAACYEGRIDKSNINKITWRKISHPTNRARYRMASIGLVKEQKMVFVGGSHNPYNYNGIGYNNEPSHPSKEIWIYDNQTKSWQTALANVATMDHRGALLLSSTDSAFENKRPLVITIGGMGHNQEVLPTVNIIDINKLVEGKPKYLLEK
jgi:N-acetylneuraminic acid mutarotase